jgi:hypothetical protein
VNIILGSYNKADGTLDSKLHTYIITTNAIALLNVTSPVATGIFDAKANLVEQIGDGITVPFATVAIEGGSTFQMKAFQNACNQQIAITLYRKAGGVWFSSYWNATTASTSLKPVTSTSNVYVSGGGTCTGSISSTKLASSSINNTSVQGELVTFKATVSGTGTPTGTITFKDGAVTLGTVNLVGGIASYSTSALTVGSHSIIASYSGDLKNKASDSSPLAQQVNSTVKTAEAPVQPISLEKAPSSFKLEVYPNPTSGPVNFKFTLEESAKATLEIYSMTGALMDRIFEADVEKGMEQTVVLNRQLPEGMYVYRLTYGAHVRTGKVIKTVK